jgi:phosphate transport system substrate-binding protein
MKYTLRAGSVLLLWLLLGLLTNPPALAQAESLTIAGTGSSSPLIALLFDAFKRGHPEVTLDLISPPLGSNGALRALAEKRIDLAIIGRPATSGELARLGRHFDFADTPFVMASQNGQRRGGFSLRTLAQVYEGGITRWDTGEHIRLVLRADFESDTLQLRGMSAELDKAVALAAKRPGMACAVNDLEAALLLSKTPLSLGPTTLGLLATLHIHITVFPLNGVVPTLGNLKNGAYPWRKTLSVVLPREPSPTAERFADFLRSPEAKALMLQNDYLAVSR